MPRATPIQASFAGGELDPLLDARTDLARWRVGLATCSNFMVLPQGGVARRPGTRHVAWAFAPQGGTRLVPFVSSTEQALVIELTDRVARFFANGGQLMQGSVPASLITPWRAEDLPRLAWAQSADVMWFVHPNHPPYELARTGPASFAFGPLGLLGHAFRAERDTGISLAATAVTGSVTVTASASFFEAGHLGAVLRLSEPSGALPYQTWRADMNVTSGLVVQHAGRVYQAMNDGNAFATPPVHEAGDVYVVGNQSGGVTWRYLHDGRGTVRVDEVISSTEVRASVLDRLPGTAATTHWQEGAWSAARGYPCAITLHEQRLWLAGTRADPLGVWASRAGDYGTFADGPDDDDGIAFNMAVTQANVIRWMAAGPMLTIGTAGGIYLVTSYGADAPIGPGSLRLTRSTTEGTGPLPPVPVEDALLYVGRSGRRLIEFAEAADLDGWQGNDLNIAAEHVLREGVTGLAWAGEPARTAWCVVGGRLTALTYRRDQQMLAWHRHPTDGIVDDVAVVPSPDGRDDQVWLAVRRNAGGVERRRIEIMVPPFRPASADDRAGLLHLDAAASWDGAVDAVLSPSASTGDEVALATSADVFIAADVGRRLKAGAARATIVSVTGPRSALARVTAPFSGTAPVPSRAWALDAGTLSGLDHLARRRVTLVLDGVPAGTETVADDGTLALPRRAWSADVGLGFTSVLETLPVDAGALAGTAQGRAKRVARLVARLHRSAGGTIAVGSGAPEPLVRRPAEAPLDLPPDFFTGDVEVPGSGGWDRTGRIRIVQDEPLPLTLLALMPTTQTTED
jgi:hypothetical protein